MKTLHPSQMVSIPQLAFNLVTDSLDGDDIKPAPSISDSRPGVRIRKSDTRSFSKATSIDDAVSSVFVLGGGARKRTDPVAAEPPDLASMSREELGGIEYRALRSLLPIATGWKRLP